jgi:hypothetical protein
VFRSVTQQIGNAGVTGQADAAEKGVPGRAIRILPVVLSVVEGLRDKSGVGNETPLAPPGIKLQQKVLPRLESNLAGDGRKTIRSRCRRFPNVRFGRARNSN